jgi:hypothetical protein
MNTEKEDIQNKPKPKKTYKSLGAMLKAGDFTTLLENLEQMKQSEELKSFAKTTTQNPISEFDDLLFFFPQYSVKQEKNEKGEMILTNEILPGAMDFLKFALENGANPNAYMRNGENTFLKACEVPNAEIVGYLVNNPFIKLDLTHTNGVGHNGLMYATLAQSTDVIEYLVKECDFNVNNKIFLSHNQTVLHYACGNGKEQSFDKLIELGANPTIKDSFGYQPYEMILGAYDEESIEEYDPKDPEDMAELATWKKLYDKVVSVTENYRKNNKPQYKTKFS